LLQHALRLAPFWNLSIREEEDYIEGIFERKK
jgi:hypothetical protein